MSPRIGVLALLLLLAPLGGVRASDHVDGPVTTGEPVSDVTDLFAFPTPGRSGHLTVVMNVYPMVTRRGHFSDQVLYEVRIRRARARGAGGSVGFDTEGEYRVSCEFETPHGWGQSHRVTCQSTAGTTVAADVDEVRAVDPASGLRVFAGRRSDPFFLDTWWFKAISEQGELLPAEGSNGLANKNVLSIVLEVDVAAELPPGGGTLLAIAAQATTTDPGAQQPRRLDRMGRPELGNLCMVARDRVDLRSRYNGEDPFDIAPADRAAYRERLRQNVEWYDGIDGERQWEGAELDALVELLLDDFLVVDTGSECAGAGFFEIEAALLAGEASSSCGGRALDDDIMDTLATLLVNRGLGPQIGDGVGRATRPPTAEFPYLAAPNEGFGQSYLSYVTRVGAALDSSGRAWWGGVVGALAGVFAIVGVIVLMIYGGHEVRARRGGPARTPASRAKSLGRVAGWLGAASASLVLSGALLGMFGALPLWAPGVLVLGTVVALARRSYWRRRVSSS